MKKKIMLAVNLLVIAAIFVLNYFYQRNGFDFKLKCVCSGAFAVLGLVNLGYALLTKAKNLRFYTAMALGLVLAMLGDVLIGYDFIVGAGTFALGHIAFIVAYCFLQRFRPLDAAVSGGLFLCGGAFLLFYPYIVFDEPLYRYVCLAYALIISLMLGKAVGNLLRKRSPATATVALASGLFFFSDLMLVLDWFVGFWTWTSEACMGTYYPALCLLAFSMYLNTVARKELCNE